jgi:hypothetical protein
MVLEQAFSESLVAYLAVETPLEVLWTVAQLRTELQSPRVFMLGRGAVERSAASELVEALQRGQPVVVGCLERPNDVPVLEGVVGALLDLEHNGRGRVFGYPLSLDASDAWPWLVVVHASRGTGELSSDIRSMRSYGFPSIPKPVPELPLGEWRPLTVDLDPEQSPMSSRLASMESLCLLHTRDGSCEGRPLTEIVCSRAADVTWADVQGLVANWLGDGVLESLLRDGVLSRVQYRAILDGKALADDLFEPDTGIYRSIHHLVWHLHHEPRIEGVDEHRLFRGHFDARWTLESTLLRADANGGTTLSALLERLEQLSLFLDELREDQHALLDTADLSDGELLAIGQHFGLPTPLLDFTHSIHVAAFFATHTFRTSPATAGGEGLGAVLELRGDQRMRPTATAVDRSIDIDLPLGHELGLDLSALAGIRFGMLREITPRLPTDENRIERQQGVFVAGAEARQLASSVKIHLFRQFPGKCFEDLSRQVTESELLPANTRVAALAAKVKQAMQAERAKRQAAAPASGRRLFAALEAPELANTIVARPSIVGARGARVKGNLEEGHPFFRILATKVEDAQQREALARIIDDYFELCAASAVFERVPSAMHRRAPDPAQTLPGAVDAIEYEFRVRFSSQLVRSLQLLAGWGKADAIELMRAVAREYVKAHGRTLDGLPAAQRPERVPGGDPVALAVGLYLASWDRLQSVEGSAARTLAGAARHVLETSK